MKWDFGDRRQSCAGNQEVNSVRVSRNDEQRQKQSGNFKLVTQRFVSTFSRRATKRQTFTSDPVLNSIFTIFALRPSSSLIQSPMSAASSALPRGEIQLTASRSKFTSSTPTIVNASVAPFLSFSVTVAPNVTLLDGASGGSTTWTDARICSSSVDRKSTRLNSSHRCISY